LKCEVSGPIFFFFGTNSSNPASRGIGFEQEEQKDGEESTTMLRLLNFPYHIFLDF
jgi:hypothetical protein